MAAAQPGAAPGSDPPPAPYPQPYPQPSQYPEAPQPGVPTASPPPINIDRRGFTLGLGLGFASLSSGQDSVDAVNGRFFVGGWLSHTTALTFDASSYAIDQNNRRGSSGAFTVYGLGLQHYVSDRAWVSGVVGSARVTTATGDSDNVFSLVGRGGYNIVQNGPHALSLTLEFAAGFFEPEPLVGLSAGIGYQLL